MEQMTTFTGNNRAKFMLLISLRSIRLNTVCEVIVHVCVICTGTSVLKLDTNNSDVRTSIALVGS